MWERTLQDLIRGLRANKTDERKFIQQAIEEIRREVRGKDMELKAGAILKMTFLDMLGYDLTWANFNIIEVMSSQKYHLKTIGYLAASQSFSEHTDVLMLTTNLLKKDLSSTPADVALALNGLSHFVTPDLARDLTQELNAMLNHSRAHIRKRVVLALFKVIQQHPDALPYCLPRLKEKLEDPDASVVSSTVNLFCELSRRNPQDFLILAPPLFHILTTSSNNWMLIKVIKLFGAISPFEPRLVKKLQDPITDLIQTTSAISLLYECVHTCIVGGMLEGTSGLPLARLCVTKLSGFLENDDQNLKFIAMMAMVKIVPIRPDLVAEHQAVILNSLDDFDISIRMRALDLISSMVTSHNAQFLVQQLLSHLVKASEKSETLPSASESLSRAVVAAPNTAPTFTTAYRLEVATRVIDMCSRNMYENVRDFDWYLSVLLDLIYVANADVASIVREQLMDVVIRVKACRAYAVKLMTKLLDDDALVLGANDPTKCTGVLWAAAWICGEYCDDLSDPRYALMRLVIPSIALLPADIISIYLQSAVKVLSRWLIGLSEEWSDEQLPQVKSIVATVLEGFQRFVSHADVEVQER
ncbi:AP-3 complex subunit delta, partial [Serendipita sp. 399]